MRRLISFHAADVEFFDTVIDPLVAGGKINPESFLSSALSLRSSSRQAEKYRIALELLLEQAAPPPPPEDGTLWDRVRTRLERFDHKPSELVRLVARKIEPDLHLRGRPFFVTEGSADRVAALVDEYRKAPGASAVDSLVREQLVRLDPGLGKEVEPEDIGELSPDGSYRAELLRELKDLYEMAGAGRQGLEWGRAGTGRGPAREMLERELPWRAVRLHAMGSPFWVGYDVDGLEGLAQAAGTPPPDFLVPPRRLFLAASEVCPELYDQLGVELKSPQSVGGFVAPGDVSDLLEYLGTYGSRIIQVATRHGEGPVVKTLLRKMRECASYAALRGAGYLEASGIAPPGWREESEPPL